MGVLHVQTNGRIQTYSIKEQVTTAVDKVSQKEQIDKKQTDKKQADIKKTGFINAGELTLAGAQQNSLKELFAKKAAWKLQADQFKKDLAMDDTIQAHRDLGESLQKEAQANQLEVTRLNSLKEGLRDTYGVEADSEEQKDLELLEKKLYGKEPLTSQEEERIAGIGSYTDYQKNALEYAGMANVFQTRADDAGNESVNEERTVTAIKLNLLKSNPMLDAKKEAEDMLLQLDEEIQKKLLEELKKKVNDKLDNNPIETIITDPQALVNNKKATEEDLKGLAVDEKV